MGKLLKNGWQEVGEPFRKTKKGPTGCAMTLCEGEGWMAAVVERWVPGGFTKITIDCFGFADILAVTEEKGALLIQVTANNGSSRVSKIVNDAILRTNARTWLRAGNRISVWDYRDRSIGGKKYRQLCVKQVLLDDVERRRQRRRRDF